VAEEVLLVLSTLPDSGKAREIARGLVENRLAACVNILPGIESIYEWQGKLEASQEVMLLIKTTTGRYQELEQRLRELHPYELPEIISVSLFAGLPKYLTWITEHCDGLELP
jgi:periplasmic divalent cation tolerance protein